MTTTYEGDLDWRRLASDRNISHEVARGLWERARSFAANDPKQVERLFQHLLDDAAGAGAGASREPGRETLVNTQGIQDPATLGPGKWTRALLEGNEARGPAGTAKQPNGIAPVTVDKLYKDLAAAAQASQQLIELLKQSDPATIVEALRELRKQQGSDYLHKIIKAAGSTIERVLKQFAPDLQADAQQSEHAPPANAVPPANAAPGVAAAATTPGNVSASAPTEAGAPAAASAVPAAMATPVQMKAKDGVASAGERVSEEDVHQGAAVGISAGGGSLPHLELLQKSFGRDLSYIKAHSNGNAEAGAKKMGAKAFATGNNIVFGETPDLHTVAHEVAHILQQQAGVTLAGGVGAAGDDYERRADEIADLVVAGKSAAHLLPNSTRGNNQPASNGVGAVQMRRIPTNTSELLQDPKDAKKPGVNHSANAAGMKRVVQLAQLELSVTEKASVETTAKTTFSVVLAPGSTDQQIIQLVDAITKLRPDLVLGDPAQIDVAPKPGIEATSLNDLVKRTNLLFDLVSARDKDVGDVFGTANVARAKAKYASGKQWLNQLHLSGHIVNDRSGYNDEVGLGGLTGFQTQVALSPQTIDASTALGVAVNNAAAAIVAFTTTPSPALLTAQTAALAALKAATSDMNEASITLLHEAMHAGNNDVSDKGYINDQSFSKLPEATKLANAAHFEVVARRVLNLNFAFAGEIFVPAGTTSSTGIVSAPLSASQQGVRDASESIRLAWTLGLNLHTLYGEVYKNPLEWTVPRQGGSFADGLPYWSKVEMMTIHQKTTKDPSSSDPAAKPVSQIDMAISEGVTRQLMRAMSIVNSVPNVDADAAVLLASHISPVELAAATTTTKRRDVWILFALRSVGSITGDEKRDLRVVHELEKGLANWDDLLKKRNPNGF